MKLTKLKPKSSSNPKSTAPKRWLLNAFIYLLMFLNVMMILLSFMAIAYLEENAVPVPGLYPVGIYSVTLLLSFFNIFCLLNLLRMHRWAFWGYLLAGIATCIVLLITDHSYPKGIINAAFSLANVLILFCLLYMGGKKSAWKQLN